MSQGSPGSQILLRSAEPGAAISTSNPICGELCLAACATASG